MEKDDSRTMIMTGNTASGWGAYLSRAQVVAAYPITPQTTVIETLADLMNKADWPVKFVNVESEHSAMAACIGAAMAGARAFTATSAQGLALMHELLHWAAGARVPLVMIDVNRAMAPGWSIWSDQNDSLSQRDTGWMQLYTSNAQDVLDSVIHGYKVAETLQVPVMVILDAFILSHTAEAISVPSFKTVDAFLPPRTAAFSLDVENPASFGGLLLPEYYQEVRERLHLDMRKAIELYPKIYMEWKRLTGREYSLVKPYRTQDAEVVLITSGAVSSTAEEAIDRLREQGIQVGLLQIRLFRPFPDEMLRHLLRGVPKVAVLDRNCSFGHHGIFFEELKSALYSLPDQDRPKLYGYIAGLGGRDVSLDLFSEMIHKTLDRDLPDPETMWLGATLPSMSPKTPQDIRETMRWEIQEIL